MIPLTDLRAQYRQIGPKLEEAVLRVLRSGRYALGPEVDALEREFAAYCATDHAVGTSSGTSALYLALQACGIGPGDEVVTVPFTFVATAATILQTGATARFVDIDPSSLSLDPRALESIVTDRTRAIVPVHLFGQPADMTPILEIARARGIVVIEDAAQAHGARDRNRPVGSIGDVGCFSFYPSKNLGACGEAGMVVTNDPQLAERVRLLRNWGQTSRYTHVVEGWNYRLEAIQAATLRVKLRYLDGWNDARRRVAARYDEALADLPVATPRTRPDATHVYHLYVVRSGARDAVLAALRARGIQAAVHYPTPVHLQPAYTHLGFDRGRFPEAERAAEEVISLPMFPELTESAVRDVADAIRHAAVTSP